MDFGELGVMFDEESGRRRKVWALVFTAAYSRHTYLWLSFAEGVNRVLPVSWWVVEGCYLACSAGGLIHTRAG